ncbi:MAG TPA: ATP synthase F0 subunit B [Terriglobales bacterium]|jgi:F-type H+-transporting ATPase subunit b|nr:ATP synthase F0 subunit B [Terriglobales bacterium]
MSGSRGRYLLVLLLLAITLAPRTFAQKAPVQSDAALVHQSKEAAGEDETAEFRKSPSVQLVARMTGLSLENAYWLSMGLNFAIIAGLVIWFSKKSLPGLFRSRTESIQKAMAEARKASEEAKQRLTDIESRLSKLDSEIADIAKQAERDTADEEARIKAATEEDVRKVIEAAEQEIVAAGKAARRELTRYAADLAVSLAQTQIQVNDSQDEALLRGFARQLSGPGSREDH